MFDCLVFISKLLQKSSIKRWKSFSLVGDGFRHKIVDRDPSNNFPEFQLTYYALKSFLYASF